MKFIASMWDFQQGVHGVELEWGEFGTWFKAVAMFFAVCILVRYIRAFVSAATRGRVG